MSHKDYFSKATTIQALSNKSAQEIASEVESVGYQTEDIVKEERFIPQVDFSFPRNFARYGSAAEYYDQSLKHIYDEYPYDGSLQERLKWENESTYLDLHIYENQYPRTNGYIKFSADGWGTLNGSITNGYGLPTTPEYIYLEGGPHVNPNGMTPYATHFTGSNYYEPDRNRETNLKLDPSGSGVSVEFWLKKEAFDLAKTEKEVIFDLWNGETYDSPLYGRFTLLLNGASALGADPFLVTLQSGSTQFVSGAFEDSVVGSSFTTASIADGDWHHYAFTFLSSSTGITSNFYVDGTLSNKATLNTLGSVGLNEITGALRANIGALITSPSASSAAAYAGKLTGSLDELRYWKKERSGRDIGRFWFTQVGGGTNDDPAPFVDTTEDVNTYLGVYYKFNEGITGFSATDSVVLDYSGRITNGTWTGYTSNSRSTGSAIVESSAAIKEFKDPIIYSFHPLVEGLATSLETSGSSYDVTNNSSIYNSIPAWITEEDAEGQKQVKYLTQILSSYFDTLHLQIQSISGLGNITYPSGSQKALPFAERLLPSVGMVAPDLFLDADVLEKLADRSEDRVFEKSLSEIKNTIYKNIYNNLVYIYKTKGTEKSFRNLIRCFGIDDELVKLNMYGNGIQYELRNNRRIVEVIERQVDFNTEDGHHATVYQYQDPTDTTNTTGYIPANYNLTGGYAQTLEAEILFPKKLDPASEYYIDTNAISSSLFGVHGVPTASPESTTTWPSPDNVNYQVYAVRDEITSDNVRFVLTGTDDTLVPELVSDLYQDTYNNTHWNLAVRIKPEKYPQAYQVDGTDNGVYTIELHGIQVDAGVIRNEFTLSGSMISSSVSAGIVTGSKRVFVGAHRTDFTGDVLQSSDVKVNACRYWLDYLDDKTLRGHIYDTQNYGSLNPHRYAFPFVPSASYGEILQADTLLFNWEFAQNTGSDSSGLFTVVDEYSGSATLASTRWAWLGPILEKQYSGRGQFFTTSSTTPIDKDYVVTSKLQLPENVHSSDMVTVLGAQEQNVFTRDSRPINYFFAFEKSMAQAVSAEMINYFATLQDINNLIGEPVNRYRPEYKGLRVLRQRFFERVSNSEIDFEKFYEFYKWFDSSLTSMLQQLVPASADFAESVRTIIESHVLERSKYQSKFQNVKQQDPIIQGPAVGVTLTLDNASPEDEPTGTGFYPASATSRRQVGSSQPIDFFQWKYMHAATSTVAPDDKSLQFDGINDYVNAPQLAGAGNNAAVWEALVGAYLPYSISLWINPIAMGDTDPIIVNLGTRDRVLKFDGSSYPAYVSFNQTSALSNNTRVSSDTIATGEWTHIVATFEGAINGKSHIYINGELKDGASTVTTAPETIASAGTTGLTIGGSTNQFNTNAYMCDVAVWDKELDLGEVAQVYSGGTRKELTSLGPVSDNLLSWWMMGSDPDDTYDGTIYDQKGGRNGTPYLFDSSDIVSVSPPFGYPYAPPPLDINSVWWQARAERYNLRLSQSLAGTNTSKQLVLNSNRQFDRRSLVSPYKFGGSGRFILGGVGFNQNKNINFVYEATRPFGPAAAAPTNAPVNVIVGSGSEVEQLMNTADIYHPAYKQRLGFGMNPSINRNNEGTLARNGNLLLPFSIYSSSVTTGYNSEVVENYATGVMITNLHHDLVHNADLPMQGPFTEAFVGGREYRHTPLNQSGSGRPLDTAYSRGEGWKLVFSGVSSSGGGTFASPSMAVVPPNYDANSTSGNVNIPIANRFRNVGAKRPVNLQNILMTTASVTTRLSGIMAHAAIGNYQKNYQVVSSGGRRKNDPFFKEQIFDFALYPETLATRGRFPLMPGDALGPAPYYQTSSLYVEQTEGKPSGALYFPVYHADFITALEETQTWAAWVKLGNAAAAFPDKGPIGRPNGNTAATWFYFGDSGYKRACFRFDGDIEFGQKFTGNEACWRSIGSNIPSDIWTHVAITYDDSSTSNAPTFYVNGISQSMTLIQTPIGAAETMAAYSGQGNPLAAIGFNIAYDENPANFSYSGYQGFGGCYMSDFAFWKNELSDAQIYTLYDFSGSYRPGPWDLNELDLSGSANQMNAWYSFGRTPYAASGSDHVGTFDTSTQRIYNRSQYSLDAATSFPLLPNTDVVGDGAWSVADISPATELTASGGGVDFDGLPWDSQPGGTPNSGGVLNYSIPARTGSTSNDTIIVNRFAGCGYEVMSLGYMDPAHEEMSVYNALPYRNLSIIDYGLSGSASIDPSITGTIRVEDQLGKNRGLDQRFTLHCGPFGSDAAYGSVPELTYVTTPSYHKVNRNARTVRKEIDNYVGMFAANDGTLSYVQSDDTDYWNLLFGGDGAGAQPFTVACWIKPHSLAPASTEYIWQIGDAGAGTGRALRFQSGDLVTLVGLTTWKREATNLLTVGVWSHVVVTYAGGAGLTDADSPIIYVNGVSGSGTINSGGDVLDCAALGFNIGGVQSHLAYDGAMAELAVWNTALDAASVTALYNTGDIYDVSSLSPTNLRAWYRFNPELGSGMIDQRLLPNIPPAQHTDLPITQNITFEIDETTYNSGSYYLDDHVIGGLTTYKTKIFNNWYVQDAIPRSTQQYSWVTSSLRDGYAIYDLQRPSALSAAVLSELSTGSTDPYFGNLNYAGLLTNVRDHVSSSTHTLGEFGAIRRSHWGSLSGRGGNPAADNRGNWFSIGTPDCWNSLIGGAGSAAKPYTLSAWIYLQDTDPGDLDPGGPPIGPSSPIFTFGAEHRSFGLHALVSGDMKGRPQVVISGSTTTLNCRSSAQYIELQKWHHIAMTFAGGNGGGVNAMTSGLVKVYVDGNRIPGSDWTADDITGGSLILNGTVNITASCGTGGGLGLAGLGVGTQAGEGSCAIAGVGPPMHTFDPYNVVTAQTPSFTGEITDVGIWNTEFTGEQITTISNMGMSNALAPANQVAWYRFDPFYGDVRPGLGTVNVMNHFTSSHLYSSSAPASGSTMGTLITVPLAATHGATLSWKSGSGLPPAIFVSEDYDKRGSLSALLNSRNGPYGYPTWKQIRTGEHPVARQLRKENIISALVPPPAIEGNNGLVNGLSANEFVDYIEQPLASNAKAVSFTFEDNNPIPDDTNNMSLHVSYQNNLDYFSHNGLNQKLNLHDRAPVDEGTAFTSLADFTISGTLSALIKCGQRVYPSNQNVYQTSTRTRPNYDISNIWNDVKYYRALAPFNNSQGVQIGLPSAGGTLSPSGAASVWPLDMVSKNDGEGYSAIPITCSGGGRYYTDAVTSGPNISGSGELQNLYCRFSSSIDPTQVSPDSLAPAAAYVMPILAGRSKNNGNVYNKSTGYTEDWPNPRPGSFDVLIGHHSWSAGEMSGLSPYKPYEDYAEMIRLVGKDMTIIPEFRISEHIDSYINDHGGDFLAPLNNIFTLTGAAYPDSSTADFYKTYSTADFMKYFKVVDDALVDRANAVGDIIRRHSIELSCDAILQFLPYKGFYPAERTVELAALLSQSLGPINLTGSNNKIGDTTAAAYPNLARRILLEPLVAPGILFNTIKTGVACSSLLLMSDTSGANFQGEPGSVEVSASGHSDFAGGTYGTLLLTELNLDGTWSFINRSTSNYGGVEALRILGKEATGSQGEAWTPTSMYGVPLPFEAIRDPEAYLSTTALGSSSYIYDTGVYSASMNHDGSPTYLQYLGPATSPLYKLAIDNFLCETVSFFQTPLKSYVSKPEADFAAVTKNHYYGLQVELVEPVGQDFNLQAVASSLGSGIISGSFGMYSRASAFGPMVVQTGSFTSATRGKFRWDGACYDPWLPPHWYGSAVANIIFKAPWTGQVKLDDILGNAVIEFHKKDMKDRWGFDSIDLMPPDAEAPGYEPGTHVTQPQITSSINILDKLLIVPPDTNTQQARWLIQPKFETPILNFYGVPAADPLVGARKNPINHTYAGYPGVDELRVRGMWHQYGNKLSGSEGVFLNVKDLPLTFDSTNYGTIQLKSLNDVVGFQTDQKRLGDFANSKRLEEAIVCVPFLTVDNDRRFFDIDSNSHEYVTQLALLNKYIFPPTFDFLQNESVLPVAFYAFEFALDLNQDDLINIWQNLPPTSNGPENQFKKASVEIKIRALVDNLLDNEEDLQWLVFKVKRRAEGDYNVFTKKDLVDGLPIVSPAIDSLYTYNWPYDYFSLVELIKIGEDVVYATEDIIPEGDDTIPVVPDLREFIPAPEEVPAAALPTANAYIVMSSGSI